MKGTDGRLWVMPLDAEPLDIDGKQLWYATDDGAGSVTSIGDIVSVSFEDKIP